jgi:hypothetical protein
LKLFVLGMTKFIRFGQRSKVHSESGYRSRQTDPIATRWTGLTGRVSLPASKELLLLLPRLPGVIGTGSSRWIASASPGASPGGSIDDLTAKTIRDLGLQVDLPTIRPPSPGLSLGVPDLVLWAIVAIAVAALLWRMKDVVWRRRMNDLDWDDPHAAAVAGQTHHLARAESLARQGSFVDAIHELLLEAVREIRTLAGERLGDALTSREILRTTLLPEQGRVALRGIIGWVEWTWFGEHTATLADYRACVDHFESLHKALLQTSDP